MFALSTAFNMTFGLVIVFIIGLPALITVLIGFAATQIMNERSENLEFERQHHSA